MPEVVAETHATLPEISGPEVSGPDSSCLARRLAGVRWGSGLLRGPAPCTARDLPRGPAPYTATDLLCGAGGIRTVRRPCRDSKAGHGPVLRAESHLYIYRSLGEGKNQAMQER